MYLLRSILASIFVSELQTTVPLRNIISLTIIILWQCTTTFGQQVWPGDINNNGIVNNIDVLYWAVANGATGEARPNATTDYVEQELPATLWDQNFPEGLNYAYADCNGDGVVNDEDRAVIEANYGQEHGTLVEDTYATGTPVTDPILLLSSENTTVAPNGTLEANLELGAETNSIDRFYGIAFTVVYDPDFVRNIGNPITLDISDDSWISGQGNDQVIQFFKNDPDNGIAEFAVVRKNGDERMGFGDIGTVSIVMEDIVLGFSTINITDIKTIDLELQDFPVAPSALAYTIDAKVTPTKEIISTSGINLYPNPATGNQVTLELADQQERIRHLQLFDVSGRRLIDRKINQESKQEQINIGNYPSGIYLVKIFSDQHVYVRKFIRKQ